LADEELVETRREFLALAAFGAVGAFVLPGFVNASAASSGATPSVITVIGIVDITQALADGSLKNNIYWFDNNASNGSQYLGTDSLCSAVTQNMPITWIVSGLEVETTVDIAGITGPGATVTNATATTAYNGALNYWAGQSILPPKAFTLTILC